MLLNDYLFYMRLILSFKLIIKEGFKNNKQYY
jgi:hypothetical protein